MADQAERIKELEFALRVAIIVLEFQRELARSHDENRALSTCIDSSRRALNGDNPLRQGQ
jgi:hypothetical protein